MSKHCHHFCWCEVHVPKIALTSFILQHHTRTCRVASNQEGLWETLLEMLSPPRMMFVLLIGVAAAGMTTSHVSNVADDSAHVNSITKKTPSLANDRDQGDPHPIDWLAVEVSEIFYTCYRRHTMTFTRVAVFCSLEEYDDIDLLLCCFCHRDVTATIGFSCRLEDCNSGDPAHHKSDHSLIAHCCQHHMVQKSSFANCDTVLTVFTCHLAGHHEGVQESGALCILTTDTSVIVCVCVCLMSGPRHDRRYIERKAWK